MNGNYMPPSSSSSSTDLDNYTDIQFAGGLLATEVTNWTDDISIEQKVYPVLKQQFYNIIIYSVAYGIIFLFAFIGNVFVIAVVCRNRNMHTVTNYFIVNLAVADILVAVFCLPITLLDNLYNGK